MKRTLRSSLVMPKDHDSGSRWDQRILKDSLCIQQQADLLAEISKRCYQNKNSTLCSEISDLSFDGHDYGGHLFNSLSTIQPLTRRVSSLQSEDDSQQLFRQSLEQIKYKCSRKTFSLISEKLHGLSMQARNEKKLERQIRYNQELMNRIQRLKKQKVILENKINELVKNQENKRNRQSEKSIRIDYQQESRIILLEKSMVQKQKMAVDYKKYLARQRQLIERQRKQNESVKIQISKMAEKLLNHTSIKSNANKEKELKKILDYSKKINENLEEQRQDLIRQYYEEFEQITQRLKKDVFANKKKNF